MSYFSSHDIDIDFGQFADVELSGLRECQIGAFWAVNSHFTTNPDDPALVSLPTGAGKTALMMLLSFGYDAERVLIVTASDVLRTQTADKFGALDGLTEAGVVGQGAQTPSVRKLTSRMTDESQWDEIDEDVVVSLPHNISKVYDSEDSDGEIVHPPEDKFDVVFFDEAHHVRAPSWMELIETFDEAKRVLLTATPFRRDRQSLPGRLVYHYSLDSAMSAELYQPLQFQPVPTQNSATPHAALASGAKQVLDDIRDDYPNAKLLVRCKRIADTDSLAATYRSKGLEVEPIHSERTSNQNEATLDRLEVGDIDGVIAVGMLGEGLDITDLKVAVLHQPPKSFAFTLQLVGRITRPIDDTNVKAAIVADPDKLREEGVDETVRRLYHEDQGWEELVPELVDEYVGTRFSAVGGSGVDGLRGVNEQDLEPYRSTRLYEISADALNFFADIKLSGETVVYRLPRSEEGRFLGLITQQVEKPTWGTRTSLEYIQYDLHLYYYNEATQTLFESSTSDVIANQIREQVLNEDPERHGGDSLVRVLHSDGRVEYQVAGLDNALGLTGSLPSYKMLLGDRVEGAIRPSDPKVFTQGHAVAEIDDETFGISGEQGRVWSSGREKLDEFVDWCKQIAQKLTQYADATVAPGLGLGEIEFVDEFPEEPIYGMFNPNLRRVTVSLQREGQQQITELPFSSVSLRDDNESIVDVGFAPNQSSDEITGWYDVGTNEWGGELANCKFDVDDGEDRSTMPADVFFENYPPYFYTGCGDLVYGGRSHETMGSFERVPDDCFVDESAIDWTDCATWVEYEIEESEDPDTAGLIDIHEWTENFIRENGEEEQIIFYDHSTGEIADYVQIEPENQIITYYHCKSSEKSKHSGARLKSVQDVIDQVLRSVSWIKNSELPGQIEYRNEHVSIPHFKSQEDTFDTFKSDFSPVEWDFTVTIVHPGIDHEDARARDNMNTVLLTCLEWLQGTDADLKVIGDPNGQVVAR